MGIPLYRIMESYLLSCQQIMEKMKHIEEGYDQLLDTWERRQEDYQKVLNSLIFIRDAAQAEMWIVSQEAFIGNEDDGVSWLQITLYVILYLHVQVHSSIHMYMYSIHQ